MCCAGALVALLPLLTLTQYAFPSADDYCLAVETRNGFWQMQAHTYLSWTGRFTATFLQATVSKWDLSAVYRWFCLATVVATFCAIRGAVATVCRGTRLKGGVTAVGAAATAVFLGGLPSSVEAFFWMASASTYQWAIITYLVWLTLILRLVQESTERSPSLGSRAIAVGLTALLPGFTEVLAPIVLMSVAGILVACRRRGRVHGFVLLLLGVALVSTALSLLAPGNALRSGSYPDLATRHNLAFALVETARQTLRFITHFGSYPALWIAAIAAWWWAPALVTRVSSPLGLRVGQGWPAVLVVTVYTTLFPLYWEYGEANYTGEGRTYNVTFFVFCATFIPAIGSLLAAASQRWPGLNLWLRAKRQTLDLVLAGSLAVLILSAPGTLQAFKALPDARSYLAAQKSREMVLRQPQNHNQSVVVRAMHVQPNGLFWGDLQPEEDHWINACVAKYYGVRSIRTLPGTENF